MSTPREREAALRRALLSAAEQIEPAPGGLERIQARLGRPRPAAIAWLEAAWTVLVMRAPDVIEAVRRRSANLLQLVWERFGPKSAAGTGRHWLSWLRPLVAMTVAVFVLGGGVYVALRSVSSTISPTDGLLGSAQGGGSHSANPAGSGRGTPDGNGSRSVGPSATSSARRSSACSPSPTPYNSGHASTGPPIQTPTPTGTTSKSSSPSTSPSPSPGTSSPGSSSPPPSSGGSVASPAAGVANGSPAATGGDATTGTNTTHSTHHGAGSGNATQTPVPSHAATGPSVNVQKLPCQAQKSTSRHKKTSKTRLTTAKLPGTKTQPGKTVAAKLD